MVERIACFLTCGYTEAGAMQSFLHKINDRYEFRQYLPNKTIKKKGMPKNISDAINGLTGDRLLEEIYKILGKHKACLLYISYYFCPTYLLNIPQKNLLYYIDVKNQQCKIDL